MTWREQWFAARSRVRVGRLTGGRTGSRIAAGLLAVALAGPSVPQADAWPLGSYTGTSAYQAAPQTCSVPARFGRMFSGLPGATWSTADIDALSAKVMAEEETTPTPEGEVDDEENGAIDAGVTYVGQFIDHDLTLDNRANDLTTPTDPTALTNGRTAAFDLDSMYGSGPAASPTLYDADGVHMKLGARLTGSATDSRAVDLPRNAASGQALLGDPRNDENRIVGALHAIMLRFHNLIYDRLAAAHPDWTKDRLFAEAQRQVRWHYQYAILTDFLPTMVGQDTVNAVLPSLNARQAAPRLRFYDPCTEAMPVEFSVGAYRFGHSMVRPIYRINTTVAQRLPVFTSDFDPTHSLVGFQPAPSNFGIDWTFFFLLDPPRRTGRPQTSYKLDNSLVFPLGLLPLPEIGTGPASLAKRNLLRSAQLGLPSGQEISQAMGVPPLRDDQILVGKATGDPADAQAITGVSTGFARKAPLWTYILAEATASAYNVHDGHIDGPQRRPMRLGPVGGRIVAETFVGLMAADASSVLYEPTFRPDPSFVRNAEFGFKEIIRAVTAPPEPPTPTPVTPTPVTPTPPTGGGGPCSPRPPVRMTTTPQRGGRLLVSVQTTNNTGQSGNAMRSIQFGRSTGAEVEVTGRAAESGPFTMSVAAGTTQTTFTVHRTAAGSVQTPFSVTDGCGEWRTFVGGGPGSF